MKRIAGMVNCNQLFKGRGKINMELLHNTPPSSENQDFSATKYRVNLRPFCKLKLSVVVQWKPSICLDLIVEALKFENTFFPIVKLKAWKFKPPI